MPGRLYRAALWLCPPGFRHDYGEDMTRDFVEAHGEASSRGGAALWGHRLLMAADLARTIGVQWSRTGLPVIAVMSLAGALALAEGLATVARRSTFVIPADVPHAEMIGLVLLATTSVCLIAMTIVLTLWVGWATRRRRR